MAASGEPALAMRAAMSGGLAVLVSWDGRGAWPAGARFWEALDESEEAAESMEGLRTGTAGVVVSGRFGRDCGDMTTGDAGGEMPAEDSVGDETWRSFAYADGLAGWVAVVVVAVVVVGTLGGVGGCAGLVGRMGEEWWSSSASKASSFSRGLRGSSKRGLS
jgi:hypothetical protein